jgi:hypothetical protein
MKSEQIRTPKESWAHVKKKVHRTNEWMAGAGNAGLCGGMSEMKYLALGSDQR